MIWLLVLRLDVLWFLKAVSSIIFTSISGCVLIFAVVAYSKLAQLPPEYGLYSSFVGVSLYWFFATSKDITIGPVAVMSTLVGNIVGDLPAADRPAVASALALICGVIVLALGLLRLGFIVDYIPLTAIAAFMTGSALSIAVGQLGTLFGNKGFFNTRDSTYMVFINFLKYLPETTIDAAMGLTALFMLYFLRWFFATFLPRRYPRWQRTCFFLSTLRTAFVILLYTMISWLVNRNRRSNPLFGILKTVPRGFQHMGVPELHGDQISLFSSQLPAAVIVLLIEHIVCILKFTSTKHSYLQTHRPSPNLSAASTTTRSILPRSSLLSVLPTSLAPSLVHTRPLGPFLVLLSNQSAVSVRHLLVLSLPSSLLLLSTA